MTDSNTLPTFTFPVNNVRIIDLPLKGQRSHSYGQDGRAILLLEEAKSFIATHHREMYKPYLIFITWDDLSRVEAVRMARKSLKLCKPDYQIIRTGLYPKEDAVSLIKSALTIHGFPEPAFVDGILLLTDNLCSTFSHIINDQSALQDALTKAISVTKTVTKPPVFVSDRIVWQYFDNRQVAQRHVSAQDSDDEETSDAKSANAVNSVALISGLENVETKSEALVDLASKIAVGDAAAKDELVSEVMNKADEMKQLIEKAKALACDQKEETQMKLEKMEQRLAQSIQIKQDVEDDLDRTYHALDLQTAEYRTALKENKIRWAEEREHEKEQSDAQTSILTEQIGKLQMQLDAVQLKQEFGGMGSVVTSSSESDDYDEIDAPFGIAKKPARTAPCFPNAIPDTANIVPIIAQSGGEDNGKDAKQTDKSNDKVFGTPAKFGLKMWNEEECSFLEHLARLDMGLSQAEEKGCSLKTRQNLVLMTLPTGYEYVNDFLVTSDKTNMDTFKTKLIELICGTNADQTSVLLKASRRPDENILSYFRRLKSLYLYCTKKTESDLDNDAMGLNMFYQKIAETLPQIAKIDFVRLCEEAMGKGEFTFELLKRYTVQAARKAPKTSSVLLSQVHFDTEKQVTDVPKERSEPGTKEGPRRASEATPRRRELRTCFFCKKPGHIAKDCYRKRNRESNNNREPKTDGDIGQGTRQTFQEGQYRGSNRRPFRAGGGQFFRRNGYRSTSY